MPSSRETQRSLYRYLVSLGICPKCRKRDRADEWSTYCAHCKDYQERRNFNRK